MLSSYENSLKERQNPFQQNERRENISQRNRNAHLIEDLVKVVHDLTRQQRQYLSPHREAPVAPTGLLPLRLER